MFDAIYNQPKMEKEKEKSMFDGKELFIYDMHILTHSKHITTYDLYE